jgi:hypothetical protein
MNLDTFWQLIESTHRESGGDNQKQFDLLVERLVQETVETIIAFDTIFDGFMDQAYRWDLWAAANFVHGGCGDDDFSDFRGCLIAQGRFAFESVLENPDNLTDFIQGDGQDKLFESFTYAAPTAYDNKTSVDNGIPPSSLVHRKFEPTGNRRSYEEYPTLFPRLAVKLNKPIYP